MGSESNNINDARRCANGCGFFGSDATMNFCSKCYRDLCIEQKQVASAKVSVEKVMNYPKSQGKIDDKSDVCGSVEEEKVVVVSSNRCLCCKKKVGILGFKCKCGCTFCGSHRYPEKHGCTFDFTSQGKEAIEKANPVVKGSKLGTRI